MNEKLSSHAGDDHGVEALKKELEGSSFDVNGEYGEFINTNDTFVQQFTPDERRELQYESHRQAIDPALNIYAKDGILMTVNFRSNAGEGVLSDVLRPFHGKRITREIVDNLNKAVLAGVREYFSPEKRQERAKEAQERTYKAYEILRSMRTLSSSVYEHPLYKTSEKLQSLDEEIDKEINALVSKLHTRTSDISQSYLSQLERTVRQLKVKKYTDAYTEGRKRAEKFSVDNLENIVEMTGIKKGTDTMFSTRRVVKYLFNKHSKEFEKYGYTSYLKKVVKEVQDKSIWHDERLREKSLVDDTVKAVDLRLGALSARLHASTNQGEYTPGREELENTFMGDAKEFVDMLVGAGDVTDTYLYDPKLAARWGQEIVSHMNLREGIDWAKKIDSKIGYWQSAGQKSAAAGLFAGIRHGLQVKFQEESSKAMSPAGKQYYQEKALEMSRLFRIDVTIKQRSESMLGAHQYYDRLRNAGNDHEFAIKMTQNALGFEDLAFCYMTFELREADPLSQKIQGEWPSVRGQIEQKLGPEGMKKLNGIPEFQSMVEKVNKTPQSVTESAQRYSVFLQLKSLADGSQVDQAAMQKDIREQYEPYLKKASKEFSSFLSENHSDLTYGNKTIGKVQLTNTQKNALAQLADMEGYGWFDFSDETMAYIYMVGKIVGMIAVGVAAGIATGGMSLVAQMAVTGIAMTATGVVMEGTAVDSVGEGVKVYGSEIAVNALGVGIGRVLGAGRYAATLRQAKPGGLAARQIFAEAMKDGGIAKVGQYYDEAVSLSTRLLGATAEGAVDVTASSWVDTQLIPGTTFIGNLQSNALFMGFPLGMEFRRDVMQGLKLAPASSFRNVHRLSGKITLEIDVLSKLCGDQIDPQALYKATDIGELLSSVEIPEAQVKSIVSSVGRLKTLEVERVQVFDDMDRLVKNRLEVMERAGSYDESAAGRTARGQAGLDLLEFEGLVKDSDGKKINFKDPDTKYAVAMLEAHDIGTPPYTKTDLKQKREILLKVFTADQTDTIIRTRIAGSGESKINVDSDEIYDTESYQNDCNDIAKHTLDGQATDHIPSQKRNVDPSAIAKIIFLNRSKQRARLDQQYSNIEEPQRLSTVPKPSLSPFPLKEGQRVWVCNTKHVPKADVISSRETIPQITSGPARVIKPKGEWILQQAYFDGLHSEMRYIKITPDIQKQLALPKNLHAESVARLSDSGTGWKLRLNFNAFNKDLHKLVFRELTYLKDRGLIDTWKLFHGGQMADGKTSTLFVGDGRKAKMVTDYLESLFGDALWMHKNADDIAFGKFITGRFEISELAEVGQYVLDKTGPKTVSKSSGLSSPAEVEYVAKSKKLPFSEQLQKTDEYFAEMYGAFYNGAFGDLPNLPSHLSIPKGPPSPPTTIIAPPPPSSKPKGPRPPPPLSGKSKKNSNPRSANKVPTLPSHLSTPKGPPSLPTTKNAPPPPSSKPKGPPPPPPLSGKPKENSNPRSANKVPIYTYDAKRNLTKVVANGITFKHGMEVTLSSDGESAVKDKNGKGATIPTGKYIVEFAKNAKGEQFPTLKPLDPKDTGGNYTVNFSKTNPR